MTESLDMRREIDRFLMKMGLPPAVHTVRGSGHGCADFLCLDGQRRKYFYSITRHGGRGLANARAIIKRLARGTANGQSAGHAARSATRIHY